MAWKPSFSEGVSSFKGQRLDEALSHFSQALRSPGGDSQHIIYDSRAAVYEQLGMVKEALRDARSVITLAPDQWQGYARSARLFMLARKFDASVKMVDMALQRIKAHNIARREEVLKLKREIDDEQRKEAKSLRSTENQFKKLPVELLGEIFDFVVQNDVAALIGILRVCSYWRTIAASSPTLWDTLVLTTSSPSRKLSIWLQRSKGRILQLHVRAGVTTRYDWPFPELIQIPWHTLRVCTVVSWDVARYLGGNKLVPHAFSALSEFEMAEEKGSQKRASPGLFPLLQAAPVRSLTFRYSNFSWQDISTSLTTLTSLDIFYCGLVDRHLLSALEANPGLESIKIHDNYTQNWHEVTPISLPHLKCLELRGYWAAGLIAVISMPNLEFLKIQASGGTLDSGIAALIKASENNETQLNRLIMESINITPNMLVRLLKVSPNITSLELVQLGKIANHAVEALAGPAWPPTSVFRQSTPQKPVVLPAGTGGLPIACPALTHLNVSHSSDVLTGPLVRLVKSRLPVITNDKADQDKPLPPCTRLQSLNLDGCDRIEAEWLPWFRKNIPAVSCIYASKKKPATWK